MPKFDRVTYYENCVYLLIPKKTGVIEKIRSKLRANPNIDFKTMNVAGKVLDVLTGGFISGIANQMRAVDPNALFATTAVTAYQKDSNFMIHMIPCHDKAAAKKLAQEITQMPDLNARVMTVESDPDVLVSAHELKIKRHNNPASFSAPTEKTALFMGSILDGKGDFIHLANAYEAYHNLDGHSIDDSPLLIAFSPNYREDAQDGYDTICRWISELPASHPLRRKFESGKDCVITTFRDGLLPESTDDIGYLEGAYYSRLNYARAGVDKMLSYQWPQKNFPKLKGAPILGKVFAVSYITRAQNAFLQYLRGFESTRVCSLVELGQKCGLDHNYAFSFGFGTPQTGDTSGCGGVYLQLPTANEVKNYTFENEVLQSIVKNSSDKLCIITGYLQAERRTDKIQEMITQKLQQGLEPVVVLTGKMPGDLIELQSLQSKFPTVRFELTGGLNEQDYRFWLAFIRDDLKHAFFCSGDNTFFDSIACGRLPNFIHLTDISKSVKVKALSDFYIFLADIAKLVDKEPESKYLLQLSRSSGDYSKLSVEAAQYFRDVVAPWIVNNFTLSKTMKIIVEIVAKPRTDEWQKPINILKQIAMQPEVLEQLTDPGHQKKPSI